MATLVGNVNSAAALWTVSADIPETTDYLQVDSEIVQVRAHFPGTTLRGNNEVIPPKIRVQRAVGGTTAASHTSGATLTPVIPPSAGSGGAGALTVTDGVTSVEATELLLSGSTVTDEGGGVAGVAVKSRLLGPFHIAHDTAGLVVSGDNPGLTAFVGAELAEMVEGTLVDRVGIAVTEGWSNAPSMSVGPGDGYESHWVETATTAAVTASSATVQELIEIASAPGAIYTADGTLNVVVVYSEEDGPPAAGEADIYALIAEPA